MSYAIVTQHYHRHFWGVGQGTAFRDKKDVQQRMVPVTVKLPLYDRSVTIQFIEIVIFGCKFNYRGHTVSKLGGSGGMLRQENLKLKSSEMANNAFKTVNSNPSLETQVFNKEGDGKENFSHFFPPSLSLPVPSLSPLKPWASEDDSNVIFFFNFCSHLY